MPSRVVVDTGVFVAALIAPAGPTATMLDLIETRSLEIVVSPRLLAELAEVLERAKFRTYFTIDEAAGYLQALRNRATIIADPSDVAAVCRDPDDDYLVALARAAGAAALVSGDADLTSLDLADLDVLTPRDLLERLASP